ncbi:hypothetical protein [Winogradskyella tangerina]|uniref:hypothetical protein n=1 Tax=Winogradskyella tangerina TaxID=2023240 RepID=UPI0013009035|nr:hypothetical protein [Winogradskyella tangerina]
MSKISRILSFVFIVIIAFTSCEGRKTKAQALSEDIEEFRNSVTVEILVYEPESYVEREVDTLLHSGYRVKIKTFSDMENTVRVTQIKDTINYQTYYRNFKFLISVEKNGKTIYNDQFDKKRVNKLFRFENPETSDLKDFDELGVLKSIEFNENYSTSESIEIDIMYAIPNTNKVTLHTMIINDEGLMNIERKPYN